MNNLTEFEMENEQNVSGVKTLAISISLPTKDAIYQKAMDIAQQCKDGLINPLELAVKLSAFEKICETIRAEIAENVVNELDKENGKTVSLGAKLQKAEVGTKYDYSESEAWVAINKKEKAISTTRKEIEAMAKNVPAGTEINWTDATTGETMTVKRAAKSSTTSFKVILPDE